MKPLIEKPHAVGFTGTSRGMTQKQKDGIAACLAFAFLPGTEFHHGHCIGADDEAARIAKDIGYTIVAHPGYDSRGAAMKRGQFANNDVILPEKPYLVRNRDIVCVSTEVYATPAWASGRRRGGTWSTVQYARKNGLYVGVIGPDGESL